MENNKFLNVEQYISKEVSLDIVNDVLEKYGDNIEDIDDFIDYVSTDPIKIGVLEDSIFSNPIIYEKLHPILEKTFNYINIGNEELKKSNVSDKTLDIFKKNENLIYRTFLDTAIILTYNLINYNEVINKINKEFLEYKKEIAKDSINNEYCI